MQRFALAILSVLFVTSAAESDETAAASAPAAAKPPIAAAPAVERVAAAPQRTRRLVFTCRDGGAPVFSDRPCGGEHETRPIVVSQPSAGEVPNTRPAPPVAATRPIAVRPPPRPPVEPPDRCLPLEAQLAAIDARMREGYSAREAARLWQRWRDAKAKLRAARC
jgi:hypothetical protein